MEIRLLDNKSIDKQSWDKCLFNSRNFELYMQSAYLDTIFPKWKALVAGDYKAVFPIFEKKILIWKLLRQPLFTGPCLVTGTDQTAINSIISYLPQLFKKYHWLDLDILDELPELERTYQKYTRKFQCLRIPDKGFTPDNNLRRNLKKANHAGISILDGMNSQEFINGIKKHLLPIHKVLNLSGLNKLNTIIQQRDKFEGKVIKITNNEKTLHAGQFFLTGHNKLYIILSFSTIEGRKKRALHALQTRLINQYLKSEGILHFGGSNIERVAEYNHNYGAEDYIYMRITKKNIPFSIFF